MPGLHEVADHLDLGIDLTRALDMAIADVQPHQQSALRALADLALVELTSARDGLRTLEAGQASSCVNPR